MVGEISCGLNVRTYAHVICVMNFIVRHEGMTLISFCMQRFENIYGGKIDRHVHFEERLCLAGYMCRAGKVCLLHIVLLVYSMGVVVK